MFETSRLMFCQLEPSDVGLASKFLLENKDFFTPWEPLRDDLYFSQEKIKERIITQNIDFKAKRSLECYIFLKNNNSIIGTIGLTNIVYGPFQSCFLGYKLGEAYINNGYMTEAVEKICSIAFANYKLHRIEANVMPRNIRSKRVLEKLNFEYECISRKYLKINGKWEDHEHYVLLNSAIE